MKSDVWIRLAALWFKLLLKFYPPDFREDMGDGVVETYRGRARDVLNNRGLYGLLLLCLRAFVDSVGNGLGERRLPAAGWRRSGNWGRDVEMATRRLIRAPALVLAMFGTLTIGLGMFAVVYTIVQKVLIDRCRTKTRTICTSFGVTTDRSSI